MEKQEWKEKEKEREMGQIMAAFHNEDFYREREGVRTGFKKVGKEWNNE